MTVRFESSPEERAADAAAIARELGDRPINGSHLRAVPPLDRSACEVCGGESCEGHTDKRTQLLDDVAVLQLPEPAALVEGVLLERTLALLVGAPGVGKTFLGLDLGLSIAASRPWLGRPIAKSGPTIYVAAEGAPAARVKGWKLAHGVALDVVIGLHTWPAPLPLLNPAAVETFIAACRPLRPMDIIVDTFARCFVGGDENSAKDVGLAVLALDRIRTELDATVLALHHTTKTGSSERGSGALRAAVDTVLLLSKSDDLLQLTCEKQRDAELFDPIDVALVPAFPGASTCVPRLASEVLPDGGLSDAQGKLLHALSEVFGSDGALSAEWLEALPSLHKATFYRARKVLLELGFVRQDASGRRFFPTGKTAVASSRMASRAAPGHESHGVAPQSRAIS